MSPSTRATRSEAATSADRVTVRDVATTLNPRSTNALTTPAPIPCEAPVTTAVFRALLMVDSPEKVVEIAGEGRPRRPGRGATQARSFSSASAPGLDEAGFWPVT